MITPPLRNLVNAILASSEKFSSMNSMNFNLKCTLWTDNDGIKKGRKYSAVLRSEYDEQQAQTNLFRWIRQEILMYGKQEVPRPLWIDVNVLKSKLMLEFRADIKIPILSEEVTSRALLSKASSVFYKILDNNPREHFEPEDIRLSYWYWSCVAKGSEIEIDDKIHYSVIIEGKKDNLGEMRPLWALPLLVIVEEARYALSLIDCLKRGECGCCTAYALPEGRTCMLDMDEESFNNLRYKYPSDHQIILINYRVFDSVVPNWITRLCFDVLMQKLDLIHETQVDGRKKIVSALENERRFRKLIEYFLHLPIKVRNACGCPIQVEKARGIPIGSYFSDLIRTMSNFVMTRIVCSTILREEPRLQRFHGSKCVLTFDSSIEFDLDAFSRCAESFFGIVVDTNRSCITASVEDFHVLGYCCDEKND